MRQTILGVVGLCLLATPASAGTSNQSLNIQGVLRDATGSLQSMAVAMQVNFYSSSTGTSAFYSQTFTTVPVDNGFFSVEISDPKLTFSSLPDTWVGVQVGGDPTELPRQHLNAAPYAFSAAALDSATVLPVSNGGTGSSSQNFVDISTTQTNIAGNKTFTGVLTGAARDNTGAPMRICTGGTPTTTTPWQVYNTNGITLTIDISGCGFANPPHVIPALNCESGCWTSTGGSNAYSVRNNSFQVYVSLAGITPASANSSSFHVDWVAIGN
jgi:hypothetical protein